MSKTNHFIEKWHLSVKILDLYELYYYCITDALIYHCIVKAGRLGAMYSMTITMYCSLQVHHMLCKILFSKPRLSNKCSRVKKKGNISEM